MLGKHLCCLCMNANTQPRIRVMENVVKYLRTLRARSAASESIEAAQLELELCQRIDQIRLGSATEQEAQPESHAPHAA